MYRVTLTIDGACGVDELRDAALQLGRGNQRGFSPRLIDAIVEDADKATATLDLPDSIDGKPTRRALWIALGVLVFIGGYAAVLTPRFTNGLARVLLPASDIAPGRLHYPANRSLCRRTGHGIREWI